MAEALFCPDKELLNILTSQQALDARNIHMAVLYSGLLTFYYSILLNGGDLQIENRADGSEGITVTASFNSPLSLAMDLTSKWDVEKLLGSPEILANITSLDSFHEIISRSSYDRIYSSVDSCWEEAKRYLKKIQDLMRQ